jgi:hypothetical protein
MLIVAKTHTKFNPEQMAQPEMLRLPFIQWALLLYIVTIFKRTQYYYAWLFADAVSNLSGFGFNGFDEQHRPKWDLISNVNVWKVEVYALIFGSSPYFRQL